MIEFNMHESIRKNVPWWDGKVLIDLVPWFGEGNPVKVHRVSRYLSNDPAVVNAQLDIYQAAGYDGIRVTADGQTANPFSHAATMMLWQGCMDRQMKFCFLLDQWIAKIQPNPTQAVITVLQSPDYQKVLNSLAYLDERYVCEFDLSNSAKVDLLAVQKAVPDVPLLSWHKGYTWPKIPADSHNPVESLAELKTEHALPSMKMGSVNITFFDAGMPLPKGVTAATFKGTRDWWTRVWGDGATRCIDHQAGNWFFDQLATIPAKLKYICKVTGNDHDEGTDDLATLSAYCGVRVGK